MEKALLISLGHNASAVYIGHNGETIGYEQERLDGIKSSSRFPIDAINEIIKHVGLQEMHNCRIYISHWFDIPYIPCKYITYENHEFLVKLCGYSENIKYVSKDFTHHDAHAYSGLMFFNSHVENSRYIFNKQLNKLNIVVADGFGTLGEVISVYDVNNDVVTLRKRVCGHKYSLGLMYQYATAYCGMKENQDEYKFLGYEPMIEKYADSLADLEHLIRMHTSLLITPIKSKMTMVDEYNQTNNLINYNSLKETRDEWYNIFDEVLASCDVSKREKTSDDSRIIIAHFIQRVIENYMTELVAHFEITNLIVAGGLFYNVKLNNKILNTITGLFSVMPLAGDQGAAFGMYYANNRQYVLNSLKIGRRDMQMISSEIQKVLKLSNNAIFVNRSEAPTLIADLIESNRIVNVIEGNMEFGPRALCSTSSVFLPTKELVAINNSMNKRNEVMPCAPIIQFEDRYKFFDKDEIDRVVGSDLFMICTHEYVNSDIFDLYSGVMHKNTLVDDSYTGRPQFLTRESTMWQVLNIAKNEYGLQECLVNTSFNAHGRPIVYDTMDIVHNFNFQYANAPENNKPFLVVIS